MARKIGAPRTTNEADQLVPGELDEATDLQAVADEREATQRAALAAAEAAESNALVIDDHRRDRLVGDDWSDKTAAECLVLLKTEGKPRTVLSSSGYVIYEGLGGA